MRQSFVGLCDVYHRYELFVVFRFLSLRENHKWHHQSFYIFVGIWDWIMHLGMGVCACMCAFCLVNAHYDSSHGCLHRAVRFWYTVLRPTRWQESLTTQVPLRWSQLYMVDKIITIKRNTRVLIRLRFGLCTTKNLTKSPTMHPYIAFTFSDRLYKNIYFIKKLKLLWPWIIFAYIFWQLSLYSFLNVCGGVCESPSYPSECVGELMQVIPCSS